MEQFGARMRFLVHEVYTKGVPEVWKIQGNCSFNWFNIQCLHVDQQEIWVNS